MYSMFSHERGGTWLVVMDELVIQSVEMRWEENSA